jgi:hypothetical protein
MIEDRTTSFVSPMTFPVFQEGGVSLLRQVCHARLRNRAWGDAVADRGVVLDTKDIWMGTQERTNGRMKEVTSIILNGVVLARGADFD